MKRTIITLLFLMAAGFIFSQSNATFSTIDVRTRETFRGPFYNYDTTYFKPSSVNIPFLDAGEPLGWFLTTSKGAEAKLVRVRWGSILDSIPTAVSYWYLSGDTIFNTDSNNVLVNGAFTALYDSTYFGYGDPIGLGVPKQIYVGTLNDGWADTNVFLRLYDDGNDRAAEIRADNVWGQYARLFINYQNAFPYSLISLSAVDNSSAGIIQIMPDSIIIDASDLLYADTFWDDLTTPATAAKIGANSKPVFDYDTLGLLWDNTPVDTANSYIVLTYQLPHRYKSGTSVYLHVHYLQNSAADTSEFFIAKYKWTDMGEARVANYTRIQTNNQTVYPYTSGSLHQLAAFPAISGSGHTESSILQIILGCYSDANLYTLDVDVHFEINKPGSDSQFP